MLLPQYSTLVAVAIMAVATPAFADDDYDDDDYRRQPKPKHSVISGSTKPAKLP